MRYEHIFKDVSINESDIDLTNGEKGKLAVFMYTGSANPKAVFEVVVKEYVQDNTYYELSDTHMDCPWLRAVVIGINDMKQVKFISYLNKRERHQKLLKIKSKINDKI